MNKQQLIFMVGPDMCGKTQIAQELSKVIDVPYFKATSEHTSFLSSRVSKTDQFLNQLRFAEPRVIDIFRQTGHSMIFDRGFPCEWVYSKVMNRETDNVMLKHVDSAYADLGAKIILARRSSYVGIVDDLDPTITQDTLEILDYAYHEFIKWTCCDHFILNVDDENINREIADILAFLETK